MSNDNGNPFDAPLASEIQDHQQAQAATVAASPIGNPFDEPLMSEKAEAQAQATAAQTHFVPNARIRTYQTRLKRIKPCRCLV